jgi:hypothetical protein
VGSNKSGGNESGGNESGGNESGAGKSVECSSGIPCGDAYRNVYITLHMKLKKGANAPFLPYFQLDTEMRFQMVENRP